MSLIKRLKKVDTRPRLRSHRVTPYRHEHMNPDVSMVMLAGKARDPHEAQRLINEVGFKEACRPLPKRRPQILKRLQALLIRAEGALQHNPENKQWKHHRDRQKQPKRLKR